MTTSSADVAILVRYHRQTTAPNFGSLAGPRRKHFSLPSPEEVIAGMREGTSGDCPNHTVVSPGRIDGSRRVLWSVAQREYARRILNRLREISEATALVFLRIDRPKCTCGWRSIAEGVPDQIVRFTRFAGLQDAAGGLWLTAPGPAHGSESRGCDQPRVFRAHGDPHPCEMRSWSLLARTRLAKARRN